MAQGIDPKLLASRDTKAERYECVPPKVSKEIARSMGEGANKYGRFNWRRSKVLASTYYAAARRHLDDWFDGEDQDPDSPTGESHLTKAITSLIVLRDAQIYGTMYDDREGDDRSEESSQKRPLDFHSGRTCKTG